MIRVQMEKIEGEKRDEKEKIRLDKLEHEKEIKEIAQRDQAEKAKNDMKAAEKAYKDSNELQKLQARLVYERSREQYEVW
jgi:hypothetical protein